uniref:Uncharacterized protein n=1 Tax=Echeneis naucrates TaxID=173247 RepID=A0A665V167_ECHNA
LCCQGMAHNWPGTPIVVELRNSTAGTAWLCVNQSALIPLSTISFSLCHLSVSSRVERKGLVFVLWVLRNGCRWSCV